MSTYDDEMYKYLSIENNYKAAKQIAELISTVDKRLVNEFWNELSAFLKDEPNSFILEGGDDVKGTREFYLKKGNWKDIYVCFDTESIGIYLIREKFDNYDEINRLAELEEITKNNLEKQNRLWLCWNTINGYEKLIFNNISSYLRILPETKESLINEIGSQILEYAKNVEEFIDSIQKYHK